MLQIYFRLYSIGCLGFFSFQMFKLRTCTWMNMHLPVVMHNDD